MDLIYVFNMTTLTIAVMHFNDVYMAILANCVFLWWWCQYLDIARSCVAKNRERFFHMASFATESVKLMDLTMASGAVFTAFEMTRVEVCVFMTSVARVSGRAIFCAYWGKEEEQANNNRDDFHSFPHDLTSRLMNLLK